MTKIRLPLEVVVEFEAYDNAEDNAAAVDAVLEVVRDTLEDGLMSIFIADRDGGGDIDDDSVDVVSVELAHTEE